MLIHLEKLGKTFGEKVMLHDVPASVEREDRIGIVGQNVAGKTTLLKILTGEYQDYEGEFSVTHGVTLGYLEQNAKLDATLDIYGEMRATFAPVLDAMAQMQILERRMAAQPDNAYLLAQHDALQNIVDAADGYNMDVNIKKVLSGMGFAQDTWEKNIAVLSGGELPRLRLAKLLLEKPDVLILDEPTNHLDAESILWLEHFLHNYQGAVLAVTHDRYFLDNVAEWICEVDRGHLYPYKGNYSTYLETKAARIEAQGNRDAKLAKRMEAELEWVRSSPKARQAKNKARLARYEEMEAEARASQKLDWTDIRIPVGPRLGNKVLEAHHLHKEFDGRVLIDDLSFTLPRNGIVGVIGPNGVGKTTLFKAIVGLEPLTSGELEVGETVKISYVDQNRSGIDPDKNLWEVVSDGLDHMMVGETEVPAARTWRALAIRARTSRSALVYSPVVSAIV